MLDGAKWVKMVCEVRFKCITSTTTPYDVLPKLYEQALWDVDDDRQQS